jgi:hypothetical protein
METPASTKIRKIAFRGRRTMLAFRVGPFIFSGNRNSSASVGTMTFDLSGGGYTLGGLQYGFALSISGTLTLTGAGTLTTPNMNIDPGGGLVVTNNANFVSTANALGFGEYFNGSALTITDGGAVTVLWEHPVGP